jgi:Ca2+-binding RTX toxin-like protein
MEVRRLMAADPSIVHDGSEVTATGTDGDDVITVAPAGTDDFTVTINSLTRRFDRDDVQILELNGLGGNDRITAARGTPGFVQFDMDGGAGTDTLSTGIETYLYGGEIFRDNSRTVATRQADGSLRVHGTGGADDIEVFGTNEADGETVVFNGAGQVETFVGHFLGERQFTYYQVDGGAGDDHLSTPGLILTPVRLNGQDGNDVLDASGNLAPVTLRGGNGNDTLRGSRGNDLLYGDAGNDVFRAGEGNDRMDGGDGNDLLDGGLGADEFIGGLGIDLADYSNRTENLTIGIGSFADDGAAGEKDNVRTGVENVTTGSGNDTITGDGVRNVLRGNSGSDTIRGLGGNDFINPGTGADRVYGGDGNDEIYARDSIRDLVLDGGNGTDRAQRDSTDPRTSIEQTIP